MQKIVVALALLLAASTASYAQPKPTKINTVEFSDGASVAVSGANKARLRYHLGNNRLEVSLNGAAYAALSGGGGGSVDGLKGAYEAASASTQNRLLLTAGLGWPEIRDNATPLTTSFRVTDSTGSWWRFYVNRYGFGSFPEAATGSVFPVMELSPPNHIALTAAAELPAFYFRPATWQWSTGALTLQRWAVIEAPTFAFVGASTLADAATLAISGAPVAGTNATITRSHALWVQSGQSTFQRDALAATTAPGGVLQNTTASTGGVQVQVSPSLKLHGTMWNGAASTSAGVELWALPSYLDYTKLAIGMQYDGGAFGHIGTIAMGYGAIGIKYGDASLSSFIEFSSAATGAGAMRVYAGATNVAYATANQWGPFSDVTTKNGSSSFRWSESWQRTTIVGDTAANQPTCDSSLRGAIYIVRAAGGASDTLQACMKSAADAYAWRTVFTAP
jgi:hypothetical protein